MRGLAWYGHEHKNMPSTTFGSRHHRTTSTGPRCHTWDACTRNLSDVWARKRRQPSRNLTDRHRSARGPRFIVRHRPPSEYIKRRIARWGPTGFETYLACTLGAAQFHSFHSTTLPPSSTAPPVLPRHDIPALIPVIRDGALTDWCHLMADSFDKRLR